MTLKRTKYFFKNNFKRWFLFIPSYNLYIITILFLSDLIQKCGCYTICVGGPSEIICDRIKGWKNLQLKKQKTNKASVYSFDHTNRTVLSAFWKFKKYTVGLDQSKIITIVNVFFYCDHIVFQPHTASIPILFGFYLYSKRFENRLCIE